jgi:hypothetical protein
MIADGKSKARFSISNQQPTTINHQPSIINHQSQSTMIF